MACASCGSTILRPETLIREPPRSRTFAFYRSGGRIGCLKGPATRRTLRFCIYTSSGSASGQDRRLRWTYANKGSVLRAQPLSSSFLWFIFRILEGNLITELLTGLGVEPLEDEYCPTRQGAACNMSTRRRTAAELFWCHADKLLCKSGPVAFEVLGCRCGGDAEGRCKGAVNSPH